MEEDIQQLEYGKREVEKWVRMIIWQRITKEVNPGRKIEEQLQTTDNG